jgi:hypothetical protein
MITSPDTLENRLMMVCVEHLRDKCYPQSAAALGRALIDFIPQEIERAVSAERARCAEIARSNEKMYDGGVAQAIAAAIENA